jgi:WD40 repeat protein
VWIGDEPAQPQRYGWRETILVDLHNAPYKVALEAIEATLDQRRSISGLLGPAHAPAEEEQKEPRNPYKGLRAFTADDVGDFFGRDRLVDEWVKDIEKLLSLEQAATENGRLLTILGPSGSGKSSVVMAGLLPRLQHGALPGSETWVYLEPMVPGKHPIEALGLTLARHFPERSFTSIREDLSDDATRGLHILATQLVKQRGGKVVLLVDQCEELFTQTESEEERQRFIDLLLTATTEPRGPLLVLLTLRADFSHHLMQYPALYRLVKAHEKPLFPMEVDDLRATVEQPAALPDVQLTFEGNLVGDLLFEIQGQVGALPLLQFTLEQLFERRSDHRLTLSAYREIGGVKGALSRHAESTYTALPSEEHRKLARTLFVRLIEPGATEQDTTRRRAALSEFTLVDASQTRLMRETIDSFIAARLLTTNEVAETTTIEVSHEAVIREWKRLSDWMREAREDISLQQAISEDAMEWMRRGKPIDRLYRGTQLAESQEWARRNVPSRDEADFLQASVMERQHQEAAEQSRQARELILKRQTVNRLRYLVIVLTLFSIGVIVFASVLGVNLQQNLLLRQQDERDKQLALSRALAANANYALSQNELDRALLLSVRALQTANTYEARSSLLHALQQSPHVKTMLRPDPPNSINTLNFTSDMNIFVSSSFNEVDVWNASTRTYRSLPLVSQMYPGADRISVAINPINNMMATSGEAGVWLWDLQTGTPLAQLEGKMSNVPTDTFASTPIAFSKNGKMVASSRCDHYSGETCSIGHISVWNVTSKQRFPGSPFIVHGEMGRIVFSPDNQTLACVGSISSNIPAQLWNAATGQSIGPLLTDEANSARTIAFSPTGKILATGNWGNTVQFWDVMSREPIGSPLTGHTDLITDVAFRPDGKTLASSSWDTTIRLWDVASKQPIGFPLTGHTRSIESIAFSPDGQILVSGDEGGKIIVWNVTPDIRPISHLYRYTRGILSTTFTTDGRTIILGSKDGRIFFQDSSTGQQVGTIDTTLYPPRLLKHGEEENLLSIENLVLSRDGETLASGRLDGTIILWNLKTRKPFAQFTFPNRLHKLMLSADGQTVMAAGNENTLAPAFNYENTFALWNVVKGTSIPLSLFRQFHVHLLALHPDGKLLAASICPRNNANCDRPQIILWNLVADKPIHQPMTTTSTPIDLAFSPDGKLLTWSSGDGISLWSLAAEQLVNTLSATFEKTSFEIYQHIVFSSNGNMLASYGEFGSFILWDMVHFEPFSQPFDEGDYIGDLNNLFLDANGQHVVTVGFAGSVSAGGSGGRFSDESIVTVWDIVPNFLEKQACTIANRNLTRSEWKQFVVDEPYGKVCPDLPLLG